MIARRPWQRTQYGYIWRVWSSVVSSKRAHDRKTSTSEISACMTCRKTASQTNTTISVCDHGILSHPDGRVLAIGDSISGLTRHLLHDYKVSDFKSFLTPMWRAIDNGILDTAQSATKQNVTMTLLSLRIFVEAVRDVLISLIYPS